MRRERKRERESVPWGVSSQTHLKELYFSKRGESEAVRGRLFKKGRAGPRRATLTLTGVTLLLPVKQLITPPVGK